MKVVVADATAAVMTADVMAKKDMKVAAVAVADVTNHILNK